ncbi:unnamed protein product, partial [marine sediment metagenome]
MEDQNRFSPDIVEKIIEVLNRYNVEYLIIGKGGAIFYGYNSTTFDIDIFPKKEPKNGERIVKALRELGFRVDENMEKEIICGKDFIQIREGPFGIDLVFAPDGIESFEAAKKRATLIDGKYPVASLKDI